MVSAVENAASLWFVKYSLNKLSTDAALYIFGIERVPLNRKNELWLVRDRIYEHASDFADEYVRVRKLLLYSNCNKLYRRSVLEKNAIRFDETVDFGEDRLFNYRFLSCCKDEGSIVTSRQISIRYMQRGNVSLSAKHITNYFRRVMVLHEEKMKCFQSLAGGVSEEERLDFEAYDLIREIEMTLERFETHPEEKAENLPEIIRRVRASRGQGALAGRVGVVTAAFHVPRAKLIAERFGVFSEDSVCFIGAYGENTGAHNWDLNEIGRTAVLADFRKFIKLGGHHLHQRA